MNGRCFLGQASRSFFLEAAATPRSYRIQGHKQTCVCPLEEEVHARKWKLDAPTQDTAFSSWVTGCFWRKTRVHGVSRRELVNYVILITAIVMLRGRGSCTIAGSCTRRENSVKLLVMYIWKYRYCEILYLLWNIVSDLNNLVLSLTIWQRRSPPLLLPLASIHLIKCSVLTLLKCLLSGREMCVFIGTSYSISIMFLYQYKLIVYTWSKVIL
jgi:hypothetical protein